MPELVFDEIVPPEQQEDSSISGESPKFDELILPHSSGQFEQIILPSQPKTETEKALDESKRIGEIKATPTVMGELEAGRFGNAAEMAYESVRRQFSGVMGPTQKEKSEQMIAWGKNPDGSVHYEYRPLGNRMEREQGLFTSPFVSEETMLKPDADDSQLAKLGKAVYNSTAGLVGTLASPGTAILALVGAGSPMLGRVASAGFGVDMIAHMPEAWHAVQEADKTPAGSQERIEAGLNLLTNLVFARAALKHAIKGGATPPQANPTTKVATPEELSGYANFRITELQEKPTRNAMEQAELDHLEQNAGNPAELGRTYGFEVTELESQDPAVAARLAEERAVRPASEPEAAPVPESGIAPETARYAEPFPPDAYTPPAPERTTVPGQMKLWGETLPWKTKAEFEAAAERGQIGHHNATQVPFDVIDAISRKYTGESVTQHAFGPVMSPEFHLEVGKLHGYSTNDVAAFLKNLNEFEGRRRVQSSLSAPLADTEGGLPPKATDPMLDPAQNPRGTVAAIEEIKRRNAANTEPVIPNEPPGTKFPAPANAASRTSPGEIMSPGPGAASAREPLASYELRRFGQRFQETEGISPEIREAAGNRYYEPIPNKLTLEEASNIVEQRGTDGAVRLVRDETFAMEPRVRATLGQTLVQKLNQSHAEAMAAGDHVRAKGFLDQAVDTAEYLGEFGTRLGQGVQSFAIWSRLTPEGMLESAKRSAKRSGVELTPEQQAEIRRLSAEAHAAPEGIPRQDAAKKLADYMVQQTGIPAGDLPLSIYYTHILSGVNTHVVNAVDTALNVIHEVNTLAVSNPRAAASIYGGLMRGLGEGKYDGLLSLQEGRRITSGKFIESPDLLEVSKFGQKGGVPIAVTGKASGAAKRIAESSIAKPLNAYKYVMRMMSASDAVFFRGAEEARAGLLAHRLAESTGVDRARLRSEADSILGYDRLPQFREQAAKEGYTGAKAEARATELMIQSRPESLRTDAADYAGVSTYNHAPRGVLGYFSNQIAQISNKYPALKLFVPFTRIVANVTNRGLDNTPMGIVRALREKGLSKEERQRTLTRGIAGTVGLVGLGVLNASGAIQIHGAGPSDTERKRQLRGAGWKPFSIQVGDKYFTYTYTPVGLGLSVLGNYIDSQRYNELKQKDSLTRVAYSMSRIGTTVFSQSFLSGLSNLFNILSGDPGQSVNSLKQFFSSVATSATTPNLIRDVNHVFDPVARKSENIAQDLIRNIPVARLALKPTLNAFGEPVELSRNRFYSGQSDDPAWRLVVKQNLRVPVVDQTTFEDSDDGYLYAKIAGERMRNYIVRQLPALERAMPQQAQEMLSKASRRIFDEARQEIVTQGGKKRKKIK